METKRTTSNHLLTRYSHKKYLLAIAIIIVVGVEDYRTTQDGVDPVVKTIKVKSIRSGWCITRPYAQDFKYHSHVVDDGIYITSKTVRFGGMLLV